jgi:beta-phosphoglucomutase
MKNTQSWDALVFDFDGVVAATEPLHHRAYLAVLEPEGIPFPSDFEGYLRTFIGYDDKDAIRVALGGQAGVCGDAPTERRVAGLVRAKEHAFAALLAEGDLEVPGALALARAARAAGVRVVIASGATRADILATLATIGGIGVFEDMTTADDVAFSKPHPETYAKAVAKLGLNPARCVAIEDTPAGLRSARAAGLFTVGLPTSHPADQLAGLADRVVDQAAHLDWPSLLRLVG